LIDIAPSIQPAWPDPIKKLGPSKVTKGQRLITLPMITSRRHFLQQPPDSAVGCGSLYRLPSAVAVDPSR